jgi:type IV fimbrial biogenesis protein FimT
MVELLTAICVIGILAAASAPSFLRLLRERRVNDAASEVANLYRLARSRAMGRGSAVAVLWNVNATNPTAFDVNNPDAHFVVREATVGGGGFFATLPSSNCLASNFAVISATVRHITSFDERKERYAPAEAAFFDVGGAQRDQGYVCFTPRGRVYMAVNGGAWALLAGVPHVRMTTADPGIPAIDWKHRQIIIPPTGAARVVTEL